MLSKHKLLALFIASCMIFTCGCNKNDENKIQVALITDEGTIEDASFNEAAYNGMKKFCEEKGLTYSYFIPQSINLESYEAEMENAIKQGAEVLVCPGYLLEEAVYDQSKKHDEKSFILIDGEPHNADYSDTTIPKNVMPILFAEEEAGFLAGYAAVRDGYRNLAFIGGMPEDPVIRYGYGFVQGADFAAIELGVKVYIYYTYANTFLEDDKIKAFAQDMYKNGTEIIFACGGAMGLSVMKAAEASDGKVIGVDMDQSRESYSVAFSATKNIESAVYDALSDYYAGTFSGGKTKVFTATEDGVGLNVTNAFFNKFSDIEYNAIYAELKNDKIHPYNQTDIGTTQELNFVNAEVEYIESYENFNFPQAIMQNNAGE